MYLKISELKNIKKYKLCHCLSCAIYNLYTPVWLYVFLLVQYTWFSIQKKLKLHHQSIIKNFFLKLLSRLHNTKQYNRYDSSSFMRDSSCLNKALTRSLAMLSQFTQSSSSLIFIWRVGFALTFATDSSCNLRSSMIGSMFFTF